LRSWDVEATIVEDVVEETLPFLVREAVSSCCWK
jgi:hypothetical protein